MTHKYSIAKDYTRTPGPRYVRQGKWSGEDFRLILTELLKKHDHVTIDMNDTAGFGSSFIDESFGGLVREGIFTESQLKKRLTITSTDDDSYINEAWDAIKEASEFKKIK